jgi:hypothetical protein
MDDKFWAARKLQAISPRMISELVSLGRFRDEIAEIAVAKFLIERRAAILRKYLVGINPVVDPVLDASGDLRFSNAAVDAGVADPPNGGYAVEWFRFDNGTGSKVALRTGNDADISTPVALPSEPGSHVMAEIRAIDGADPSWSIPVRAYFVREQGNWRLVGFERTPE